MADIPVLPKKVADLSITQLNDLINVSVSKAVAEADVEIDYEQLAEGLKGSFPNEGIVGTVESVRIQSGDIIKMVLSGLVGGAVSIAAYMLINKNKKGYDKYLK